MARLAAIIILILTMTGCQDRPLSEKLLGEWSCNITASDLGGRLTDYPTTSYLLGSYELFGSGEFRFEGKFKVHTTNAATFKIQNTYDADVVLTGRWQSASDAIYFSEHELILVGLSVNDVAGNSSQNAVFLRQIGLPLLEGNSVQPVNGIDPETYMEFANKPKQPHGARPGFNGICGRPKALRNADLDEYIKLWLDLSLS